MKQKLDRCGCFLSANEVSKTKRVFALTGVTSVVLTVTHTGNNNNGNNAQF